MPLVNKTLASLTGGVSQQAAPLRLSNQCEDQENFRSSLVNGLQNRPPLNIVSNIGQITSPVFYPADRDQQRRYNLLIDTGGIRVIAEDGTEQTVTYNGTALSYLSLADTTLNRYKAYKVLTLADHIYVLNTTKTTALTNERYEDWKNVALVFIKQVAASTTWTLTLDGNSYSVGYGGANTDTGLPDLYINGTKVEDDVNMSTAKIAQVLRRYTPASSQYIQSTDTVRDPQKNYYHLYMGQYQSIYSDADWQYYRDANNLWEYQYTPASEGWAGFTTSQVGSVLWIRKTNGTAFSIGISDTRSDSYSSLVTSKVQQFSDLPTIAPDGYIARVVGTISNNADDYYVMFRSNTAGAFDKGVWVECAEPGSYCALDASTMPHELVHTSGTSWVFRQCTWAEKETGDLDSSPIPEFIGKKLNNIFLFMNRLCFLSEDMLCMSRAADHTNWWNETAITLSDSDPIFLTASTEALAELYDFGVLDDDLILFSARDQFRLSYGDTLSPKTAAIKAVSNSTYTNGTGIVTAGTRLYFGYKNGNYYSVYEFGTSAVTGQKESTTITAHVPNYIKFGTQLHICGSENVKTLCVYSNAESDVLYVYSYYISGANKLQSAWHKYRFTGCQIKGAFFRENMLWLCFVKKNTCLVGTIDLAEHMEGDIDLVSALDYLVQLSPNSNTVTVPSYMDASRVVVISPLSSGVYTQIPVLNISGQVLTLKKSVVSCYVGEKYERKFTFTKQYPTTKKQDGTETAITSGRWQLQTLSLNYGLSGPFAVHVRPVYNDSQGYVYTFSGVRMGQQSAIIGGFPLDSGIFTLPLRGRNIDLEVEITTDSWLPESFISAEWQGMYITKVKQL